jgi:excisionase family DNA binding protein
VSEQLYSVDQVAERLGLHVRTVRAYIRDGRLKALRLGKSYRITRGDLESLIGPTAQASSPARHIEASCILEMEGVSLDASIRLANALLATLNGRKPGEPAMRAETLYDPDRKRMKFILLGDPGLAADLLKMITMWSDAFR